MNGSCVFNYYLVTDEVIHFNEKHLLCLKYAKFCVFLFGGPTHLLALLHVLGGALLDVLGLVDGLVEGVALKQGRERERFIHTTQPTRVGCKMEA